MKFKVGDLFKFDTKSMKEYGHSTVGLNHKTHQVVSVEIVEGLGEIVGYGKKSFPTHIHADWLIKTD